MGENRTIPLISNNRHRKIKKKKKILSNKCFQIEEDSYEGKITNMIWRKESHLNACHHQVVFAQSDFREKGFWKGTKQVESGEAAIQIHHVS